MSQTGAYSVTVKCLTKKCLVCLDQRELDFGVLCVGETYRQNVVVLNAGALSTEYTIAAILDSPSSILKPRPKPLEEQPLPVQLAMDKDPRHSNYSIMTAVEPVKDPDNTTGLGVILPDTVTHHLKSKSIGQITFSEPQANASPSSDQDGSGLTPQVQGFPYVWTHSTGTGVPL